MGLDKNNLPEHLRSKISPEDRRRHKIDSVTEAVAKGFKRWESIEQKDFYAYLFRHEFAFQWNRTDKPTRGVIGAPDFIIPAYRLAIEFKVPPNKPTPEQIRWRLNHEKHGGIYRIVATASEAQEALIDARLNDVGVVSQQSSAE